jgi:hypothetical protein
MKRFVTLSALLLSHLVTTFGETSQYIPKSHELPATSEVRLLLPASVGASTPWMLGVEVVKVNSSPRFSLSRMSVRPTGNKLMPFFPDQFTELDPSVRGGDISVSFATASSDPILIYFVVPKGKKVTILAGDRTLFSSAIEQDVLLKNGVARREPLVGPASLAMTYVTPDYTLPVPRATVRDGVAHVNLALLKSHVNSWVRPEPVRAQGCCTAMTVEHEVVIGLDGRVAEVRQLAGDPSSGSIVTQALRQWVFRPFEIEGRTIVARARVPFTVTRSGAFVSPLL